MVLLAVADVLGRTAVQLVRRRNAQLSVSLEAAWRAGVGPGLPPWSVTSSRARAVEPQN
ncbi:MAG TPA: hypothetical protein VMF09_05935 [Solirubrobacteraceae bacterium]|nr:hypothetical protein [Solirubrobacteraceae bacterium]